MKLSDYYILSKYTEFNLFVKEADLFYYEEVEDNRWIMGSN